MPSPVNANGETRRHHEAMVESFAGALNRRSALACLHHEHRCVYRQKTGASESEQQQLRTIERYLHGGDRVLIIDNNPYLRSQAMSMDGGLIQYFEPMDPRRGPSASETDNNAEGCGVHIGHLHDLTKVVGDCEYALICDPDIASLMLRTTGLYERLALKVNRAIIATFRVSPLQTKLEHFLRYPVDTRRSVECYVYKESYLRQTLHRSGFFEIHALNCLIPDGLSAPTETEISRYHIYDGLYYLRTTCTTRAPRRDRGTYVQKTYEVRKLPHPKTVVLP